MRDLANRQKQMEEELQEELESNQAAMKEEITNVSIKMQANHVKVTEELQ